MIRIIFEQAVGSLRSALNIPGKRSIELLEVFRPVGNKHYSHPPSSVFPASNSLITSLPRSSR